MLAGVSTVAGRGLVAGVVHAAARAGVAWLVITTQAPTPPAVVRLARTCETLPQEFPVGALAALLLGPRQTPSSPPAPAGQA